MKRNTKIALVMMALSAMAMGSTSAFAHGGHGMWPVSYTHLVEKEVILAALEKTGVNKTEAARQLGITRKTLLAKLSR